MTSSGGGGGAGGDHEVVYIWTSGDVIMPLAELLEVHGYGCALSHMHGQLEGPGSANSVFYLCCDVIEEAFVNHRKMPILAQFRTNAKGVIQSDVTHMLWRRIRRQSMSAIRLYICNESGAIQSFQGKGLYCTLTIRNVCGGWGSAC